MGCECCEQCCHSALCWTNWDDDFILDDVHHQYIGWALLSAVCVRVCVVTMHRSVPVSDGLFPLQELIPEVSAPVAQTETFQMSVATFCCRPRPHKGAVVTNVRSCRLTDSLISLFTPRPVSEATGSSFAAFLLKKCLKRP